MDVKVMLVKTHSHDATVTATNSFLCEHSHWYPYNPGISLTLVYSSTNMSKSVWTSGFWKPLVHKNMSNFWNNIFHKLGLHFACVRVLRTFNVWKSELWCGQVTFLNHSSTIRVPKILSERPATHSEMK